MKRQRIWIPETPNLITRPHRRVGVLRGSVGRLEGWFDVELIHARTGLVKRKLRFRNLITNAGLNSLGPNTISSRVSHLAVGTNGTTPDVADVSLNEIARTNQTGGFPDTNGSVGSDALLEYWWVRRTRTFTEAQANGNLAELGFFNQASGGTLWNRQLFLDEQQEPTVITKTSDDVLRIRYEWRMYPPWDDWFDQIMVGAVETDLHFRAANVATSSFWGVASTGETLAGGQFLDSGGNACRLRSQEDGTLGARNSQLGGGGSVTTTPESVSFPGAGAEIEFIFGPTESNWGNGVDGLSFSRHAFNNIFQWVIDPAIPKQDTERLVVELAVVYERHTP